MLAQDSRVERLKQAVADNAQDLQQVKELNQLAALLFKTDLTQAEKYAEQAEKLARQLNDQAALANALALLGDIEAQLHERADRAAEKHQEAYQIYRKLYEEGRIDKWKIYDFVNQHTTPTYNFISDNKVKRKRKGVKIYQTLQSELNDYLTELAGDTKKDLKTTEKQLDISKTNLEKKKIEAKKQALEKLALSGTLAQKELEAIALADTLLLRELELKSKALRLLREKEKLSAQKAKNKQLAQEKALHEIRVRNQRIVNISLILGLLLGAGLLFFIYKNFRNQKKANILLKEQNEEIAQKNEEIYQQNEEIAAQRDNLEDLNRKLSAQRDNLEIMNAEITAKNNDIQREREKSDSLLLNVLPQEVAEELKETGHATPRHYDLVSVLFTDFKGFTKISEKLSPEQIIKELDYCFLVFDEIVDKYDLEKIKTIGDAYMCAGGLPKENSTNPIDAVKAALAMQRFMEEFRQEKIRKNEPVWELRIGIHTGPLVAGVIGNKKFAYDIWGDTVNLAARMESSGEVGKVNISGDTYEYVKSYFNCSYRGKIKAKNKGEVDMYFVEGTRSLFQSIQDMSSNEA